MAAEPQIIAKKLVKDFHTHLHGVNLVYLFQNKTNKEGVPEPTKRKGKVMPADTKLVSGLSAFLSSDTFNDNSAEPVPYFALVFCHYCWNQVLNETTRVACVDEQLCRCWYDDEKDTLTVRPYDFTGYHENVKRYGAWHPDLETFLKVAKQQPLPGIEPVGKVKRGRHHAAHP